jgi:predicted transcriptional regulator
MERLTPAFGTVYSEVLGDLQAAYSILNFKYTLKMSRKQYYLRLSKLIRADMIKRKGGKYLLTPFGAVIYGVQLEFVKVVNDHFKSKRVKLEE